MKEMNKSILIGAAVFAAGAVQAAEVPMPDMSGGGTYTLDAGDSWVTATNGITIGGGGNVAVININGDWTSSEAFEVKLGDINANDNTDFLLNIGASGSVDISKHWMAMTTTDGSAITSKINIDTGGQFGRATTGQFCRYRWPGNDWNNSIERLWDEDALSRDGLFKSDLSGNAALFESNFSVVGDTSYNTAYTITAILPPLTLAVITPSVTEGPHPLEVIFAGTDSTAEGTIIDYDWELGDGNTATGVLTTNTYTVAGDYTVWLTISDDLGNVASNSVVITVNAALQANITTSQDSSYAPVEVVFNGSTSTSLTGNVTSYAWAFGDGGMATGPLATNTFTEVGTYTTWLTVTDDQGNTTSNSVIITAGSIDYGVVIDDEFDNEDIGSNPSGIGTGFDQGTGSDGSVTETNGAVIVDSPINGGRRARIASKETADTSIGDGASYLFEGVNFAFSADDSGDGFTHRTYLGIRDNAGAGDEQDNPEEGFFVEFGFGGLSGNADGTSTFFYNNAANVKTTLATWTFDNLLITDAVVSSNILLDIEIVVDPTTWSIDIVGDTAGGSPISFSGTHAAAGITNTVDTGHVFAHNQSESPNLAMAIGHVVVDQIQSSPLVDPDITAYSTDGSTVSLTWISEAGFHYNVLSKADLVNAAWSTNVAAVPAVGDTTSTNLSNSGGTVEFFKIEGY